MRRLIPSLVVLFVFAGCADVGDGGNPNKGAVETPAKLERCVPAKTGQGEAASGATLSTAPQAFGGIEVHTNGDVVGFVEDEQCRVRVGYIETPGDLEELEKGLAKRAFAEEIPLSTFEMISDTQQFFLNNAGNPYTGDYTAKMLVKDVQSLQESEGRETENDPPYVTIELRSYREGRMNSKAIFRNFSAPLGARLQLTFPGTIAKNVREENLQDVQLLIDANGDSSVDKTRPPSSVVVGSASGETDPPQTRATVQKGQTADELIIKLASDDTLDQESGKPGATESSGVHQVFYSVKPPGNEPGTARAGEYTQPFSVPLGSTVYYYSVDRAGNFDTPRQVVADQGSIGTTTSEPISGS